MQFGENWSAMLFGLAETSLYERELAKKLQAEAELTNAIFRMPLGQFDSLLENAQEVVVLAVAAILLKNVGRLKDHIEGLLTTINEILKRWYQPNGVFKRSQDQLKGHIENTFGQFMGNCLKLLVYKDENKEFINRFLDTMTGNPNYRLYLYYRFIESVTTIDTEISYVTYRTLLNNFQSTFLPKIFEALYPYFMNISDSMDINELSFLQNSMSVGEAKLQGCVLEFNGTKFTEIVFSLLEHVMTFKFNISPREYEEFEENQTGMMSFPDTLLTTILRGNFLDALYNVLIQLMKTKEFKYQLVCLGCLKKILLAKTTYIQLALRDYYILKNMEGVFKLLKLIVSTNSVCHRLNAVCILQCNSNFISTFGLDTKLLRGSNNFGYLNQWLELTRTVPLFLLQNDADPITIDNQLFQAGVTMTVNLANQLKLNNITSGREVYYSNYQAYTREFLNKFIVRGQDISGAAAAKQFTFEGFIKTANDLLGGVKLIFSYNYAQFLGLLNDCCEHLFTGSGGEFSTGNLLILIRELFRQHKFFSQSVFGLGLIRSQNGEMQLQGQKAEEVGAFGAILSKTLNFIIRYQSQSVLDYHYLNNCIIIFMSALLEMCTIKTDSHQPQDVRAFFINSQIYLRMKEHLRKGITDQEFLLNCLQTLSQLMHCPQLVDVQYIFQTLLECIERIKWSMRGQYFKYSPIYHEMGKLFTKLSLQAMPAKLIKLRSQLFNIITVLSFDDQLDSYRQNIRNTLELVKASIVANEWPKILYDLTGIFQSMESPGVFRFFIRNFLKELDFPTLMKQLFTRLAFAKPSHYLRDVLYLSRMMLNNKNKRISASNTNESIYSISRFIVPYWSYCFENADRLDAEEAVVEIYIGAKDLFGQAHVNICNLDNIMPAEFRKFMKLLLLSMYNSLDIIESSAELSKSLLELAGELIKTVVKALFNFSDEEIGMGFHQFISKLMSKLAVNFNNIVAGAFEERLLEPIIHIIHDYYIFLRDNRKKQHLSNLFRNISRATNDAQDKDLAFQAIVKIAMEFRQHFTVTLLQIASICVNLVEFYRIDCKLVVEQLGLSQERDVDELRRIFKHIEEKLEDFEWLSYQMKDWFNMKSRFDNCKITEY